MLKDVKFPKELQTIGNNAFYDCDALETVILPDSVTSIDFNAFYDCDSLETITIPNSVTSIGSSIFANCDKLKTVSLGTGITTIPTQAFFECPELESISLPYRVTTINSKAFGNCTALKEATILRNVTSIAKDAFSYPNILTIYGVAGTTAETYANDIGAKFVAIDKPATSVSFDKENLTLNKGASYQLIADIAPADFTDATAWKTSDDKVVTVSGNGLVKAVGVGEATVSFVAGNVKASCKVTVVQPVTSISLNKTSLSLDAGATYTLTATVSPSNAANKSVIWSSSDASVATVNQNGVVTALKKGTATITAKAQDGSNVSRSCTVTVTGNLIVANSVSELQSAHPYAVNCNDIWQYSIKGASSLNVSFSADTCVEDGSDYIYLYQADGTQVGKYTGTALAGKTITVPGDTVRIKLFSDGTYCEYGFRVTGVSSGQDGHTHSYTAVVTAPTCTERGYTTHTCSCGDSFVDTYTDALGHAWDNGTVTKQPTETSTGVKTFSCTRCTATKTETIPELGHTHSYTTVVTAPTCTERGYTTHTCSCGDSYADNYVVALGHDYKDGKCTRCGELSPEPAIFADVPKGVNYYDAVLWAADSGITTGYGGGEFRPKQGCTRGQVVTFLWRAAGQPEPKGSNPFVDVEDAGSCKPYYKAIVWAAEQGITTGLDVTHFAPNATVTRAQFVTFLWRYEGKPASNGTINGFADAAKIATPFRDAVAWAVEKGITTGYGDGTFRPTDTCTRWAVVLFMYRGLK